MKLIRRLLTILAVGILVIAAQVPIISDSVHISDADSILRLIPIFLATSAFGTALYTLYARETRLRANSENVSISLVVFLVSTMVLVLAFLGAHANFQNADRITSVAVYVSIEFYIMGFLVLFLWVFMPTYNQTYNLRTDKVWRYFKPIRSIVDLFPVYKRYEFSAVKRANTENTFMALRPYFSIAEIARISQGASILFTGHSTEQARSLALSLVSERLSADETANYVCADRHPLEIWTLMSEQHGVKPESRNSLVFIDAFTPNFAFNDDIQKENTLNLTRAGVNRVPARTFAGLHTATNKAFNIIKAKETAAGLDKRRPMTMVYAHTSALCDFEGIDQFRIFWRHVIPSERNYGMLTIIVEDENADADVIAILKQRVDYVLNYQCKPDGKTAEFSWSREL